MIIVAVILIGLIIVLLIFIILTAVFLAFDLFYQLPFVATRREKIATIINFANLKKGDTVVDLGSGDGRLLFAAAQKGAISIGYEINPVLILFTQIKVRLLGFSINKHKQNIQRSLKKTFLSGGKGSVTVIRQNLWQSQTDLKKADVIFVYAYKKTMQTFEDFVYKNAKKGTRIVVNTNPFPAKQPIKSENGIFLYIP